MDMKKAVSLTIKLVAVLLLAGIGWVIYQLTGGPKYSEQFQRKCADMLVMQKFDQFYAGGHPKQFQEGRWKGKIALFELPTNRGGVVDLQIHPVTKLMDKDLVAANDEEATTVGFIAEAAGRGGIVIRNAGLFFLILVEAKTSNILGIVLIKEFSKPPLAPDFEAEYPNMAKKIKELHS